MPEFGPNKYLIHPTEKPIMLDKQETKAIKTAAKEYNKKIIGIGSEVVVLEGSHNERLLAIVHTFDMEHKKDPIFRKQQFYVHKILNTIFPENFPKVYASFMIGEDSISGMAGDIREKIIPANLVDKTKFYLVGLFKNFSKVTTDIRKRNFQKVFDKLHILEKSGFICDIDPVSSNFITDKNGNGYYVDKVNSWTINPETENQLGSFMKQDRYSDTDIQTVKNSLERIIALQKEKEKEKVK